MSTMYTIMVEKEVSPRVDQIAIGLDNKVYQFYNISTRSRHSAYFWVHNARPKIQVRERGMREMLKKGQFSKPSPRNLIKSYGCLKARLKRLKSELTPGSYH